VAGGDQPGGLGIGQRRRQARRIQGGEKAHCPQVEAGEKTPGPRTQRQAREEPPRDPQAGDLNSGRGRHRSLAESHDDLPAAVSHLHVAQRGRDIVERYRSFDMRMHRAAPEKLDEPMPHARPIAQCDGDRALA